ncbi:phosphatase [Rubrobacter marinus]|uniref:phosphatase n=1 Tax=Rubrobacter marinus TaxID=2653852 RepID=UPI00140CA241|nr:phosphatase [Rubrobacter marinus]
MDPVAEYAELILRAGLAGTSTSHGGDNNVRKIKLLLEGDESTTFGMEALLGEVGFDEAYRAVERTLGYGPDHEETPGRGCIDPARTAAGLLEAGGRIREVAAEGGRVVIGTGHPGALLLYYLGVARWVEDLGGRLVRTEPRIRGAEVPLDWAGAVAILGNGASMKHTHDPAPMRSVLGEAGTVDLVVADHGFAGAAVAAGIPAVAIMDTNDPAWAVVSARGRT